MSTTATMMPRRTCRKQPNSAPAAVSHHHLNKEEENGEGGFEDGKWRFENELLRDECSSSRIENELFALKNLEKNRVEIGKKKTFEGKNENAVLEEEIEDLAEKLEKLQTNLRIKTGRNRDKENYASNYRSKDRSTGVDMLRTKMEGFPKGLLDRVEEDCGPSLSSRANRSVPGSASISKRIDRFVEPSTFSSRKSHQEPLSLGGNICSGRCKAIIGRILEQVRVENEQWSQMQLMVGRVRGEMEELQASRDFWESHSHDLDREVQSLRRVVKRWRKKALCFENEANELQVELSSLQRTLQKPTTEPNSNQNTRVDLLLDSGPVTLRKQLEKEKYESSTRFGEEYNIDEKVCKWANADDEELNEDDNIEIMPTKDSRAISLGRQLVKEKLLRLKEIRRANKCNKGLEAPNRVPLKDVWNLKANNSSFNP